jgi:uncharacterized protein YbjT (DUF2867 family)
MKKPKILVTSAAGHTGKNVVFNLLKKGYSVRAFVRRIDSRSKSLKKAGAEIFVGDLFDFQHLRQAMVGVQRAYHCPPFANNLLHNSMLFSIAAEEAKLEVVVLLSAWNPQPSHSSIVSREHWITNQVYQWMPSVDVVYVNPGLFAFTYMLGLPVIKHFGMFVAPFGGGKNAPPSGEDIGRVISTILINPAEHIGKNYRPTGPLMINAHDVANTYSKVLSRKVTYQNIPFNMFAKAAIAQGFSLMDISQLRYYTSELRSGGFEVGGVTDHVELVTGEKPETFEETTQRYLNNPSLIHPLLEVGGQFATMLFMMKMLLTRVPNLDKWEVSHGHPLLNSSTLSHESEEWLITAKQQKLNLLDFN